MGKPNNAAWTMPEWMEPYRDHFTNTGGNSIEDLMNDKDCTARTNVVRAALIIAVESQVILLSRLRMLGALQTHKPADAGKEGK